MLIFTNMATLQLHDQPVISMYRDDFIPQQVSMWLHSNKKSLVIVAVTTHTLILIVPKQCQQYTNWHDMLSYVLSSNLSTTTPPGLAISMRMILITL